MHISSFSKPLIAVICLATPAAGQMDQFQVQKMMDMQTKRYAKMMRTNPVQAKQQFITHAFSIDPEGNVTAEKVARQQKRQEANLRARSITMFLAHDLDADGVLSMPELEEAEAFANNISQRSQIRMMRIGSDADGDGAINISELYDYAAKTRRKSYLGSNRAEALLTMDGNGDGTTTIDEIIAHIDAVAASPEPNRTERPTIGMPRPLPKE